MLETRGEDKKRWRGGKAKTHYTELTLHCTYATECPYSPRCSIDIFTLNLQHLLGRTVPGPVLNNSITTAIFQIIAKVHELLIVASLTTIVLSVIRNKLLGAGLPLGFLSSGFT